MKNFQLALGVSAVALAATGNAEAALLGVVQTFPDTTLSSPTLIYDNTGGGAGIGRLTVVANATTLNEGPTAGNSTATQSYFGTGDTQADLVLTIDVNNANGAFVGGNVSIGMGNLTTAARWSWQGTVTNFGFNSSLPATGGSLFDATWTMSSDSYQNMPSTLSQFVNGYLTGGIGGIKIATSNNAFGTTALFSNDWVFNSSGTIPTSINSFTGALTTPVLRQSTISADIWAKPVPVPGAVWLFSSALLGLGAMRRRS